MVQASDLRINNWVEKTEIKFSGPRKKYVQVKILDIMNSMSLDGIPVTGEILEKCGFVFTGFTWDTGLHGLSICLPSDMYPSGKTYFNSWTINEGVPDFLHQLQNLYYALTGTELPINL